MKKERGHACMKREWQYMLIKNVEGIKVNSMP